MAHDLETRADGRVAFALVGDTAWHGLAQAQWEAGTYVPVSEMLEAAFLAKWNVRTEPWEIPAGYNADKDFVRIIRDNPFGEGVDILGQALASYHPAQNEDLAAFGDALTAGGASPESAGSIKNGRQVFLSWLLPNEMVLDASGRADVVKTYLMVTTSHDGSASTKAVVTPVRPVCRNTMTLALRTAKSSVSVRHTRGASAAIEDARRTIGLSFAYMDAFQTEVEALIQTTIKDSTFESIIARAYPKPDEEAGKASLTKWETRIDHLWDIYRGSTCENIRDTAWGAYNALTEQLDYGTRPRKGSTDGVLASAAGFDPARNAKRADLFEMVKALV